MLLSALALAAGCKSKPKPPGAEDKVAQGATRAVEGATAASSAAPGAPRRAPSTPHTFPGATPPADALRGPRDIRYKILKRGAPDPNLEGVRAELTVWTPDGQVALSTLSESEQEASFTLPYLPQEFHRIVTDLGIGGEALFWLPGASLTGWKPAMFPKGDVIVRMDVLSAYALPAVETRVISGESAPAAAPPSVSGPPADAIQLKNGLAFVTMTRGNGEPPAPDAPLDLRVSAWTIKGVAAERVLAGLTISTAPNKAPGGLGDVLVRVPSGSTVRVWVPAKLSASILPDHPGTNLILDAELPR